MKNDNDSGLPPCQNKIFVIYERVANNKEKTLFDT